MRTVRIILCAVTVLLLIGGGLGVWLASRVLFPDHSLPPPLLEAKDLGRRTLLFDGTSPKGWTIAGPSRVADGTLEIGGEEAAIAKLDREFAAGETVEFDGFHDGPGNQPQDAVLKVRVETQSEANGPWTAETFPDIELRWKSHTPSGGSNHWHHVRIVSTIGEERLAIETSVGSPLYGGGSGYSFGRSPVHAARFTLEFLTSPGNRLRLRNVCVTPR